MEIRKVRPARQFKVGKGREITISHTADISLAANEQVTFVTDSGSEYDVVRKSWGFYATPSLNGRLLQFGLRAVLVKSDIGRYFIWLVERGKEADFQRYLTLECHDVVQWLDSTEILQTMEQHARID